MAKNVQETEPNKVNRIVAGTGIKGDIDSNGDIRFEGDLVGNLSTKGKLIVGNTGLIKGEVKCKNADIEGKIEGKIHVSELLTLKSTAIIEGDILAKRLAIETGAKFTGNCSMSDNVQTTTRTTPTEPIKK